MSYEKQGFASGDVLYAAQLNAMDDQIADNEEEITGLKSALNTITGNTIIDFTLGGYIGLPSTGVDVENPTSNNNYRYAVVSCSESDIFTIDVKSESSVVRTYGFVDDSGNRLTYGSTNSTAKFEVKAPENAEYLVLNDVISNRISYRGRLTVTNINTLQQQDITENTMLDALNTGKRFLDIFADRPLQKNYAINTNTGTVGSTSNNTYYARSYNYVSIKKYSNIFVVCDPTITEQFWYAFFDENNTLIDSVINVNPAKTNYGITIPANAKGMSFGGKTYNSKGIEDAIQKTTVYGNASYFDNEELDQKINGAIDTLKSTTGVNKLRVTPNSNNINFAVKTGITNLYLGYGAGGYNGEDGTDEHYDDAKYNVAVGFEAFKSNESGDHSVAVGYECLRSNTSGDFNTAIGEDAMYGNTTGSNNIAIGDHVLQNNNGSNNVAIGARAMRYATAGSDNIVIGKDVGHDMSTGSHNIVIGNGLDTSSGNANNEIIIGDVNHSTVVIAGKTISFNQDGTVTWS